MSSPRERVAQLIAQSPAIAVGDGHRITNLDADFVGREGVEELSTDQPVCVLLGVDFFDMQPHLQDGYVVKGLIQPNTFVGIIGATGSGKTFFATDLAVHIAAGMCWRGHRVRGGLVIYAALEGPMSAERRFYACRTGKQIEKEIPLRLTPGPLNLREDADVVALIRFVRDAEGTFATKCTAIFVDTLSRAMAGGDENGPDDMGALIAGADKIRIATGAAVILIHHLGKDQTRGARGHSSFKAALDTEIEVSQMEEVRIATVTKHRDLPAGSRYAFKLEPVDLGRDDDGEQVQSCVIRDADQMPTRRKFPVGKNKLKLLSAIHEWQRAHAGNDLISSIDLREVGEAQGLSRNRLSEAKDGLVKDGWLQDSVGGYLIVPEA